MVLIKKMKIKEPLKRRYKYFMIRLFDNYAYAEEVLKDFFYTTKRDS